MPDDMMTHSVEDLTAVLKQQLGTEGLKQDDETIELMSQDIWAKGHKAEFVAIPETLEQLAATVEAAHSRGISLNPRGGGMSYTKAYAPDRENIGILDMSKLDKVVEVNTDDMYATVQAGCTWKTLYETLKAKGVRTPFWGPLSGLTSTVGGGLSQNNAFFGSGKYGTTGDSVLSVTAVLADGTIVRTGTGGVANGKPFWRHYGPDLTGLFVGDAGTLGYKAEITFRLIPMPEHEVWSSYEFKTRDDCANAMAALMREDIACEIFGFDPNLTRVRMTRESFLSDAKTLTTVMKKQGSLIKALKEGAKIAMAGRDFIDDTSYTLHFVVEGRSAAGVAEETDILRDIAKQHNGTEIENSIPKIIRANPFSPLNNMLGPRGERWVPIHGIVPVSQGAACWKELDDGFEAMQTELEAHDIIVGALVTTLGTTGYLIEPVFIWPEELFAIHEHAVEDSVLAKFPRYEPNPDATAMVETARQFVLETFSKHGAAHFQIGRTYPYREGREPASWEMLEKIKDTLDPKRIINPGSLGLD